MFNRGFAVDYCGQSSIDDVSSMSSMVILAFADTQPNGKITVYNAHFPTSLVSAWKSSGKKALLSVGGQNGP